MRPVMDRSFPMADIVEAFKYQETNQHFGKICLDI
ncbi:Oxidoreductase, zinc-binding protein [Pseudomonas syringae pv. maculicola]|nr:Oxidoreductase, zinc-binding protein [Pseudomonas syringae pv. maculicola]